MRTSKPDAGEAGLGFDEFARGEVGFEAVAGGEVGGEEIW